MNARVLATFLVASCLLAGRGSAREEGRELFEENCSVCHTIGEGKLVGPDLAGVTSRRPADWLLRFIRSSQSVIQSGDRYAADLFEKYDRTEMPDADLSDEQIRAVIAYIAESGSTAAGVAERGEGAVPGGKPLSEATAEDVGRGRDLFQGKLRLSKGGPACNSCHDVRYPGVAAGGSLARDLTRAFSRQGEAGLRSIVRRPPFPAMKQAYAGHALTEDEVYALAAFLAEADSSGAEPRGRYAFAAFAYGICGALVLFVAFAAVRRGSKGSSVNEELFRRQIASV